MYRIFLSFLIPGNEKLPFLTAARKYIHILNYYTYNLKETKQLFLTEARGTRRGDQ